MGIGDALIGTIKNSLGLNEVDGVTPEWQKRIREAAYTSPGGTRIEFQYVDLKRSIEKRTARFTFNGIDGQYIQDNGHNEGSYPIQAIFSGDEHDRLATAFEAALIERGRGKLEHPIHGTQDVVPTGTIERENAMVDSANQSTVSVTFSTTLADVYPEFNALPKSRIAQTIAGWDAAAAQEFAETVDLADPVAQSAMGNSVREVLLKSAKTVRGISSGIAEVQREYDNQARQIEQSIDTLVTAPTDLARQLIQLIKSPAVSLIDIYQRLAGYSLFSQSLTDGLSDAMSGNDIALNNLMVLCATNAAALSANETTFRNRPDAIDAAIKVQATHDAGTAATETMFFENATVDPGATYQANQESVAQIVGKLVADSFELLSERVVYLKEARTPVDLCAQFYKTLDDAVLQEFLDNNRIGGEEIYLMERGRRVVYYA